jgi:tRNA-uridine 2-sulfurtransferase
MREGKTQPSVAVAMSGGVDSSVAAAILRQHNYSVIGVTMRLLDQQIVDLRPEYHRGCCNYDAIARAQAVCHKLEIPHYALEMKADFNHYVIEDFVSEYIKGRTPNPCIRCNVYLKWGILYDKIRRLGCDYLATGHYARLSQEEDGFHVSRALDSHKDQAYALWGIPRERLEHTLFPLGLLNKAQVREIAADLKLKTAQTPESQDICFLPEGNYADFVMKMRPETLGLIGPGELIEESENGRKAVGSHSGYFHYTTGQRKGFGGGFPEPRFVLGVEPDANRVIIGDRSRLLKKVFRVDQVNWLVPNSEQVDRIEVQIRYRSPAAPGRVILDGHGATIELSKPAEAITPGQSAVFFQGERLLGGGRIVEVLS